MLVAPLTRAHDGQATQGLSFTLYSRWRPYRIETRRTTLAGNLPDVADADFQTEVLDSQKPVLVDFWAPWCGPCRVVHPVLEEIDNEREDLKIVSLNVDDNQQTAAKYEVLSIPTLILFKGGEVATKVIGAMPKAKLEAELEPALA
jgi:thioredoxin 1